MATKLDEIFVSFAEALEDLSKTISNDSSSYQFESSFNDLIRDFGQSVFQSIIGNIPKSKNDRITILTSMGFTKNEGYCLAQVQSNRQIVTSFRNE